jgi:hypothetical protein
MVTSGLKGFRAGLETDYWHVIGTAGKPMKVSFYTLDNRLRIRFSYQGTRYHFALGLDDNELGRLKAREILSTIEKDCLFDNFDPSLSRYKFNLKPVEKPTRKSGKDYAFNPKRMQGHFILKEG